MRGLIATLALILLCAGALTGCPGDAIVREPVPVTRYVYVGIRPELTRDCDHPAKRDATGRESLRVNRARGASLDECTSRMRQIRAIQGTPVPGNAP